MPGKKTINVEPLQISVMKVTIRGLSPLLTNNVANKLKPEVDGPTQRKPKKSPEEEMKECLYIMPDNRPGFPASGIKKAMVKACPFLDKVNQTQVRGALFVIGEILPIKGSKPKLHTAAVKIMGKSSVLRYRPVFEEWEIEVPIRFNERVISPSGIVALLETAGFAVGLGDWRPEKGGSFGMLQVKGG